MRVPRGFRAGSARVPRGFRAGSRGFPRVPWRVPQRFLAGSGRVPTGSGGFRTGSVGFLRNPRAGSAFGASSLKPYKTRHFQRIRGWVPFRPRGVKNVFRGTRFLAEQPPFKIKEGKIQ